MGNIRVIQFGNVKVYNHNVKVSGKVIGINVLK